MSRSSAVVSLALFALLLLASCSPSSGGLQAFFYTDSSCLQPFQFELPIASQTYLDWQHIPSSDINYNQPPGSTSGINTTCVTPPQDIDLPNTYLVQSATYNCNVNGTTTSNASTLLYVAEWLSSTTCSNYFTAPSTSNSPDFIYTAVYRYNGTGDCMSGGTYQNKSMTSSVQLYSQVFCINNNNDATSTASLSSMLVAFVVVLVALMVNV